MQTPGSSTASSGSPTLPASVTQVLTHQLRPSKDVNYRDLHLGKTLLLGWQEFLKWFWTTRKSVGKAVQTTVQKVIKVTEEFPVVSRHSSPSSTASSKWPQGPMFQIQIQNWSMSKTLKLFFKNIGRYAATSTNIHVQIPFQLPYSTPRPWLQKSTINFWINMRNLSKQLPSQ